MDTTGASETKDEGQVEAGGKSKGKGAQPKPKAKRAPKAKAKRDQEEGAEQDDQGDTIEAPPKKVKTGKNKDGQEHVVGLWVGKQRSIKMSSSQSLLDEDEKESIKMTLYHGDHFKVQLLISLQLNNWYNFSRLSHTGLVDKLQLR